MLFRFIGKIKAAFAGRPATAAAQAPALPTYAEVKAAKRRRAQARRKARKA